MKIIHFGNYALVFVLVQLSTCHLEQATLTERASAFRQHCELAETVKLKEINMYDFVFLCVCFLFLMFLLFFS